MVELFGDDSDLRHQSERLDETLGHNLSEAGLSAFVIRPCRHLFELLAALPVVECLHSPVPFVTGRRAPFTARDAGEARKRITSAIASGPTQLLKSASGMSDRLRGVSMIEGRTTLTRIALGRSSSASASVRRATPAFAAA